MLDVVFRSSDEAAGYLAALIDGEGSVYARHHRRLIQVRDVEGSDVDHLDLRTGEPRARGITGASSQ
jgi:hypothetical protein